jgi:hypothetical protein
MHARYGNVVLRTISLIASENGRIRTPARIKAICTIKLKISTILYVAQFYELARHYRSQADMDRSIHAYT